MNEDKNFNTPQTEENQSIHTEEPASVPTPFPQTISVSEQEYPAWNPQFEPPTQSNTDKISSVAEPPRKQRLGVVFYTFLTISVASIIYLSYLWFFAEEPDPSGLFGVFATIVTIPFALVGIIGMIVSLIHGNLHPNKDSQANSPVLSNEASKLGVIDPSQQRKRFRRLLIFLILNLLASIIMAANALIFSFTDLKSDSGSVFISILLISNLLILPVLSAGSLGAIVSLVVDLSAKKTWRLYTKKQTTVIVIILLTSLALGAVASKYLTDFGKGSENASEQSGSQSEESSTNEGNESIITGNHFDNGTLEFDFPQTLSPLKGSIYTINTTLKSPDYTIEDDSIKTGYSIIYSAAPNPYWGGETYDMPRVDQKNEIINVNNVKFALTYPDPNIYVDPFYSRLKAETVINDTLYSFRAEKPEKGAYSQQMVDDIKSILATVKFKK